jgi:perosamine synthetase
MNTPSKQFLFPPEQWPTWRNFAGWPKIPRLGDIPPSSLRYLFFWARNAIYHSLRALGVQPGEAVLVPAYICAAAVEPIEAFGANVVYYEVGRDCIPDFSDLEAKIDTQTRAVLAVHYFGFPCGIRQIRDICNKHGLYLIEDCAHVLQGEEGGQPLGTFGETSVFSWRKFLPLYDGGELVLNHWERELRVDWQRERFLFTLRVAKNLLERALPDTVAGALRPFRLRQPFPPESKTTTPDRLPPKYNRLLNVNPNSSSFDEMMVNFPMSRLSRVLLEHSVVENIVAKRRFNYLYFQHAMTELKGLRPLFENLPSGVCPWVFPVFFDHMSNGHFALRKLGIPAVSWGGVRHPGISSAQFPSADFLYENLIFLPVHQNLRQNDLNLIVEAVKNVLENGQVEGEPI